MQNFDLGGFFVDFGPRKHVGSSYVDLTILDGTAASGAEAERRAAALRAA